jgi:hypothetical protein
MTPLDVGTKGVFIVDPAMSWHTCVLLLQSKRTARTLLMHLDD